MARKIRIESTLNRDRKKKIEKEAEKKLSGQELLLSQIESRFKEVTESLKTDKEKSDKHGEVFTPESIVDKMLAQFSDKDWQVTELTTFDLCSGYGQFTVRMLRKRYDLKVTDISRILSEYHLFAEIQPGSCFRLLYIFGSDIRLLIGDVTRMGELPPEAERGIWVYSNGWKEHTEMVVAMFNKYNKGTIAERAEAFEKKFNSLKSLCGGRE